MSKKLSRSWFVAIIIVAGFALASCGGGDSSTSASLKKALADSEAAEQEALDAAETAEMELAQAIERAFIFSLSIYNNAISEYNTEASEYDEKDVVDYDAEADDSAVDNLLKLAQKASAAAEDAEAAAMTPGQMDTAQMAVTAAEAAVTKATKEKDQAIRTADSRPYMEDDALTRINTPMITITDTAKLTDDGVTVAVTTREDGADVVYKGAASDVGGGWYRADATVEVKEGEDPIIGTTATVYTDIEAALELFSVAHDGSVAGISVNRGVLTLTTIGEDAMALAYLNMYVMADAFPGSSRGSTTIEYVMDMEQMTSDNPRKFDGTFDGVDGKYACTTTDTSCSATANADGEFTAFEGTWTFTPDYLGADGVVDADDAVGGDDLNQDSVAVDDPDYLSFGWWTRVNEDKSVTFQSFAGGNQIFTEANIAGLTGTATYTGPAAGVYVMNRFNPNGTLDSIGQGVFTADAELTATFDDATAGDNKITGEVINFKSDSGDSLANWNLELPETIFANIPTFSGDVVEGGLGGFPVTSGKWDGGFFGNPDPDPEDRADDYPNSVAGKFDAQSANVDVAGAFGAKR